MKAFHKPNSAAKVLIAGGGGSNIVSINQPSSEELYDPATGTFSLTGQPSQDGDEMDEKNGQIAHQRIGAERRILRNLGRNNNSPATRWTDSQAY